MTLVPIFAAEGSDEGLWSILLEGETQSEFEIFFDHMNDVEWPHDFFNQNIADLRRGFFGSLSIGEAVSRTLDEAEEMENSFKPLNNFEYAIILHQKSKARVRKGWLRLYAIRLSENCYLVTGGAIKLTPDMKRGHLEYELKKLAMAKQFLRANDIVYPEDLNNNKDE